MKKKLYISLISIFTVFFLPSIAKADNCGGFIDCTNVLLAFFVVLVGIAVFIALFLTPQGQLILGIMGLIEAITGKSLLTGEKLASWERLLGIVPIGVFGKMIKIGGKSMSSFARSLQGTERYKGIDRFRDGILKKGKIIYAGEPFSSNFFTTQKALEKAGFDANKLFKGLQVQAKNINDIPTYRDRVIAYEVIKDVPVAFGIARANPIYGAGGYFQIVLKNPGQYLKPIKGYPLINMKRIP